MNLRANWQIEQYSEELKDSKVRAVLATENDGNKVIPLGQKVDQ